MQILSSWAGLNLPGWAAQVKPTYGKHRMMSQYVQKSNYEIKNNNNFKLKCWLKAIIMSWKIELMRTYDKKCQNQFSLIFLFVFTAAVGFHTLTRNHWGKRREQLSWQPGRKEGKKEGRDPTMGYRVCCIVHCKLTELSPDNRITNHEDWLTARIPHEHVVLCHGFNSTLKTSTKS